MTRFYVATVQILLGANSQGEASDGMSELLSGAAESGDGFVRDWGYLTSPSTGRPVWPQPTTFDPDDPNYVEGDFLYPVEE